MRNGATASRSSSPKGMSERQRAAKASALSRKHKHVMSRLSQEQRAIIDESLRSNKNLYESAHALVPDPIQARKAAREIKNNPSAMEFVDDARRLRLVPALELVARAANGLNDLLKNGILCKECGGDVPTQVRDFLAAAKISLDAVKDAGALSVYSRAQEQDQQAQSNEQLARAVLGAPPPKAIESGG